MPTFRLLAALLAATFAPMLASADELKPFSAKYTITWRGISAGNTSLQLEHLPDGKWSYKSETSARGLFRLVMPAELSSRSVFRIKEDHVVPESFAADDGARSDAKDQDITFDWAAGRVRGMAERQPVDLPTQPGLLDSLSVQIALMHELLAGRTPSRFVLLDRDRIKEYLYTVERRERVRIDSGEYDTVVFRSSRPGSRNGTYFWCAPALGYLPLKVERREGKEVQWSMRLQQVTR
jgi:hypothetical protein